MDHSPPLRRRLYLMRHGEVQYFDAEGAPLDPRRARLTAAGVEQALSVRTVLDGVAIDRVVCSGLPRTRETAEMVIDGRGLGVEDDERLREIRAGRLREVPEERLEAEFAYGFDRAAESSASFVGGETFVDFEHRVTEARDALLVDPSWRTMLLVGHDGVNRLLLCWAAGAGRDAMAAFEQDMGCLNIIEIDGSGSAVERRRIKALNITPYNLAKHGLNLTSLEQMYRAYRPQAKTRS